ATLLAILEYAPLPDVSSRFCTDTSTQGVLMTPGSTITTSMPLSFNSSLRQSLHPSNACFVAWYHPPNGVYILPPIDDIFTILPELFFRISGSTSCVILASPNRLTSNCRLATSMGTSSIAP